MAFLFQCFGVGLCASIQGIRMYKETEAGYANVLEMARQSGATITPESFLQACLICGVSTASDESLDLSDFARALRAAAHLFSELR